MRSKINFLSFLVSVIMMITMINGCQPRLSRPMVTPYHPVSPYQESLMASMDEAGMDIIRQGDQVRILIPTDVFFALGTAQINVSKEGAVHDMADFVKSYSEAHGRPMIDVFGYTDKTFSRIDREDLAQQYAETIASYIWDAGVPRSWLHVKGFGAQYPIAGFRYPSAYGYNRRVEVRIYYRY